MKGTFFGLVLSVLFSTQGMAGITAPGGSGPPRERPNLLLITVDTLRADYLGCYGSTRGRTPNIDRLAAWGAVFERAFAHTPTTLPSHANILTGATPLSHGVHDNAIFRLPASFTTLGEHLRSAGYATGAFIGAFPLDSRFGLDQGFDVYDDLFEEPGGDVGYSGLSERKAGAVIASAVDWIGSRDRPWFAWIHLWDPHMPYAAPEPFRRWNREDPYLGEVLYVDNEIGKLLDFLEIRDSLAGTLIVMTADHGESLGDHEEPTHGFFAYNCTLHVPLILAGPTIRPVRVKEYACHTDLFPTICESVGMPVPDQVQGLSLLPAVRGRRLPDRAIYFESLSPFYTYGWAPLAGVFLPRRGRKFLESPIPELYDLNRDFGETRNLAEGTSLAEFRRVLESLQSGLSGPAESGVRRALDHETRERMNTLGYTVVLNARKSRDFGPDRDLKNLIRYQNLLGEAIELFNRGRSGDSESRLRQIIDERPDFYSAYLRLAELHQSRGGIQDALGVLERGIEHNPKCYPILFETGSLLVETGAYDRGIEFLGRAVELVDFDVEALNLLGVAFWRKGESEKALEYLDRARALAPRNDQTLVNLGTVLLSLGRSDPASDWIDRAGNSFRSALASNPRSASAYNGLGAASRMRGRVEEAADFWEKALEIDPAYLQALYNLGTVYLDMGRQERALGKLALYLEKGGDSIPASERREIRRLILRCLGDDQPSFRNSP